jgi:hypothetical protein
MRPGKFLSCQRTVSRQGSRIGNSQGIGYATCSALAADMVRLSAQGTIRASAWPAVSFAAKCIFQPMLSGTRALDPVVLSGVIEALSRSRFWLASLPRGRLNGHLTVVLECIGD